jgi:CRP-like cAMP-binding protein
MLPLEMLESLRFLHGLAPAHLQHIASIAELRELPGGMVVFREGERSGFVYVVLEGRVALEVHVPGRGQATLHTIGPGELLGWSPIFTQGPMTATARAVGPCRLVALNAPQLLALAEHEPRFGMELMRRTAAALAQRLGATRLQMLDVYRHELPLARDEGGHA